MGPNVIPNHTSLADICIAALTEVADCFDGARAAATYRVALDNNHRLWLILAEIGAATGNKRFLRDSAFAISRSVLLGQGDADAEVATLVAINRRIVNDLAVGADVQRICARVHLAYRESDDGGGFTNWLLAQINKKERLWRQFAPVVEPGSGQPAIGGAAAPVATFPVATGWFAD